MSTPVASAPQTAPPVGHLLRDWRGRRRRSQLDLALAVGMSARHLSFIETGRARPSASMLLALAEQLALPLRDQNQLLLAGGYAPRYAERALDDGALAQVQAMLARLLDAHDPYPGLVLDRQWNIVQANRAATAWLAMLPAELAQPTPNVFRLSLHPQGLAALTVNFAEWAAYLLETLQRTVMQTGDATVAALQAEVLAYPNVRALGDAPPRAPAAPPVLVPCVLDLPIGRVSLFTTLTTFGTPRDITLDEMCVELFYPADAASQVLLRAAGSASPGQ